MSILGSLHVQLAVPVVSMETGANKWLAPKWLYCMAVISTYIYIYIYIYVCMDNIIYIC